MPVSLSLIPSDRLSLIALIALSQGRLFVLAERARSSNQICAGAGDRDAQTAKTTDSIQGNELSFANAYCAGDGVGRLPHIIVQGSQDNLRAGLDRAAAVQSRCLQ